MIWSRYVSERVGDVLQGYTEVKRRTVQNRDTAENSIGSQASGCYWYIIVSWRAARAEVYMAEAGFMFMDAKL